ncbi:MAG TPA: hypothetical protein PLP01_07210 [Phycisphaerae bacterium]|nr:hypothetical protein [Phycisphaerae bacterium]HOI55022.1 hypothetical protein [Phycisphaerae bacterium]
MKTKDFILSCVVVLNVVLLAVVVTMSASRSQAPATTDMAGLLNRAAYAGSTTDAAGFFKACTIQVSDSRGGVAVIDTASNKMCFYLMEPGKKDFTKMGTTIDLARLFQHPKR